MIPSTKARTRQREQGALKDETATKNEAADDQAKTARRRQLSRFGPKEEGARLMAATDE